MSRKNGFIFPFTIITITIVLFALSTLTFLYEQEVRMTANIKEQFVIESLFSLGQPHAATELKINEPLPEDETFLFSQGAITLSYFPHHSYFRITYEIETTNGATYSLYEAYPWAEEIDQADE